jgi:broad specificity phosphatase PhoE
MNEPRIPRRIVFWRHGRTPWNAVQRFQGQTDIPLDETGVQQAARAAGMLATLEPSRIISSDLMRARSTAEPLGQILGLEVSTDAGLRETFAGEWEGLTRTELEDGYGAMLSAWSSGSDIRPGVTGETRLEVAERVAAAVHRGLEGIEAGQALVVVTHGGAARAGIAAILGLPPEHWGVLGVLTNCSWSVLIENISVHGPKWRLQEYNAGTLPEAALADDR